MFKKFFSRQASNPTGLFGSLFMSRFFETGNARLNKRMVELAKPGGDDRILEIGFGGGQCIHQMAAAVEGGVVEGVDTSAAMLRCARKKNKRHLSKGLVKLRLGDFNDMDYPSGHFDTVCSANTLYFWSDLQWTLRRIHTVLKPGGKLVLAFVGKERMQDLALDFDVFSAVSPQGLQTLLLEIGFNAAQIHDIGDGENHEHCIVATK